MPISAGSTAGIAPGDLNSIWIDEDITIDAIANTLTISGSFSNFSQTVVQLNGSYQFPALSTTLTTYVSLQISAAGVLQFLAGTSGPWALQAGNIKELYGNSYLPGAPSIQAIATEAEPSF